MKDGLSKLDKFSFELDKLKNGFGTLDIGEQAGKLNELRSAFAEPDELKNDLCKLNELNDSVGSAP